MGLRPTRFSIPSLDGTTLSCNLYTPLDGSKPAKGGVIRGAILAHPYAPLGGSSSDGVVQRVRRLLNDEGVVVGTFNFRGAAPSEGRTTWSGDGELRDYQAFANFFIHYLAYLAANGLRNATDDESTQSVPMDSTCSVECVVGGYSYGSMIASRLSPSAFISEELLSVTSWPTERQNLSPDHCSAGSSASYAIALQEKATSLARHSIAKTTGRPGPEISTESTAMLPSECNFAFKYLLISPLLPPVSSVLSLFSKETSQVGDPLFRYPVLSLHGSPDTFTSLSKYRSWTENLSSSNGSFVSLEVAGAGHFWQSSDGMDEMLVKLGTWLNKDQSMPHSISSRSYLDTNDSTPERSA